MGAAVDDVLRYAWGQSRVWAITSRRLKQKVQRWGLLVLVLTLSGTALGTMGPFLGMPAPASRAVSLAGAALLGLATYFATQLLSESGREAWIKARALAEALKSEAYKYVTGTPPYGGAGAPDLLAAQVDALHGMASGILAEPISESDRVKQMPAAAWSLDEYITGRVREQIDGFYRPAIARHRRSVRAARAIALTLGALAVVLSAAAGAGADGANGSGTWVAALLGTVTTASAAVASWFQGGNHLQNALNYQAAAAKLELLLAQHAAASRGVRLVLDAEAIFQAEHAAWMQWQLTPPAGGRASDTLDRVPATHDVGREP